MEIQSQCRPLSDVATDWLIIPFAKSGDVDTGVAELDDKLNGQFTRLREAGDLTGKSAELLAIHDTPTIEPKRLLFAGIGKPEDLNRSLLSKALNTAVRKVSEKSGVSAAIAIPANLPDSMSSETFAEVAATTLIVGAQGQDLYRAEAGRFPLKTAAVVTTSAQNEPAVKKGTERGVILGESINLTRELVNRPAGDIFPASFAERVESVASEIGCECEVFDENRLQQEKMGSLLAVAQGSDQPPRIAILRYSGGGPDAPTLALCGKGVTFDSGGLSLKPSEGMKTMKCDMAGAATVLGAVSAIVRLKLPVNIIGLMGLVENMVSGRSYKLGDVLTARNGVTIEVLNTDAEGRLVLADVLSYAVDQGAKHLVDLATLTGACVVALGEDITGAFTNDQAWCDKLLAAANEAGEEVWQMPMSKHFAELLKSDVADIKNVGPRWGGAITAAKFLERFVADTPWVHLDIAGPSFASSNASHREGGATGCMVRTLVELAERYGQA